ncbi:hypothetical protein RsoM2USA_300 [Ralstonia phage RsoM2USA]|nr:hypothetical protein RsoM2USA_300 [Ralstonia phage RsoM2USA]
MINRHRLNLLVQLLEANESGNSSESTRFRNLLVLDLTDHITEETANLFIDLMISQLSI